MESFGRERTKFSIEYFPVILLNPNYSKIWLDYKEKVNNILCLFFYCFWFVIVMYIIYNINLEHLCPRTIFIFNLSTVTKFWILINNGDFQTMQITFQIQQLNSNRIINRLLDKFFFMKFGIKKSNIHKVICLIRILHLSQYLDFYKMLNSI